MEEDTTTHGVSFYDFLDPILIIGQSRKEHCPTRNMSEIK